MPKQRDRSRLPGTALIDGRAPTEIKSWGAGLGRDFGERERESTCKNAQFRFVSPGFVREGRNRQCGGTRTNHLPGIERGFASQPQSRDFQNWQVPSSQFTVLYVPEVASTNDSHVSGPPASAMQRDAALSAESGTRDVRLPGSKPRGTAR